MDEILDTLCNSRNHHQMNVDPAVWYNLGQTVIYGIMAIGIMRLKLFFTPHLCIIAALIVNDKVKPKQHVFVIHLNYQDIFPQ